MLLCDAGGDPLGSSQMEAGSWNHQEGFMLERAQRGAWGRGRTRRLAVDGIKNSMDMSLSKLREIRTGDPGLLQSMGSQRVRHNLATEQQ